MSFYNWGAAPLSMNVEVKRLEIQAEITNQVQKNLHKTFLCQPHGWSTGTPSPDCHQCCRAKDAVSLSSTSPVQFGKQKTAIRMECGFALCNRCLHSTEGHWGEELEYEKGWKNCPWALMGKKIPPAEPVQSGNKCTPSWFWGVATDLCPI